MRIPNRVLLAGMLAATTLPALAADTPNLAPAQLLMTGPEAVALADKVWSENKSVPAGMKLIMIHGDPQKPGPYVFRAMMPAGYKLPPHRHSNARHVVVLKGNYWSGVGEDFAQDKLRKFTPGHAYVTDAGTPHFAWAETEVVIQEMGIGPQEQPIEYVHAKDDPRGR